MFVLIAICCSLGPLSPRQESGGPGPHGPHDERILGAGARGLATEGRLAPAGSWAVALNGLNRVAQLAPLTLFNLPPSPMGLAKGEVLPYVHDQWRAERAVLSDGQFVWGPNAAGFSTGDFLEDQGSAFAPFAGEVDLWASYTSVNPRVLLPVLEIKEELLSSARADLTDDQKRVLIERTALDLAKAFYEHLHTVGARSSSPESKALMETSEGGLIEVDQDLPSGTYAVAAALGQVLEVPALQSAMEAENPAGFSATYGRLFPESDPLDTSNDITPPASPPADLLQLPFPQGATWVFNGPHSWNGDSTPPFSSMDFFLRGGSCSAPPFYYSTASAGGSSYRPSNYSCWLEIDHGGGWDTSYYHLRYTYDGGPIVRNTAVGTIACEVCAGGYATGPHVHWSLKYNGAYVSLEGVQISGWTIHVGEEAYFSGSIERDGTSLDPYEAVTNDYHQYFPQAQNSLRFFGNGTDDIDRVKILLDNPENSIPGPPIDVGATDFTLEWWMKALPGENGAPAVTCGANYNWIYGNTVFDRDRYNQVRTYGISLVDGRLAFGLTGNGTGSYTLCGSSALDDGSWHHVAVQRRRSDGYLWIYVDGELDAQANGPNGDISYPDNGTPEAYCGPSGDEPCVNDPYLVIGAEKHNVDPIQYPSYSGWLDEIRVSNILRYSGSFSPTGDPFAPDGSTVALLHLDEGSGFAANDVSGHDGGPSNGYLYVGGSPSGPVWSEEDPWSPLNLYNKIYFPIIQN